MPNIDINTVNEIVISPTGKHVTFLYKDGHTEVQQAEEVSVQHINNSTSRGISPVEEWVSWTIHWNTDRRVKE